MRAKFSDLTIPSVESLEIKPKKEKSFDAADEMDHKKRT